MIGEASISVATACFGKKDINGDSGHEQRDVLYIAFPGSDAVPGRNGAKWNARSYNEFANSISGLGDKLIQRIGGGGGGTNPPPTGGDCSWPGHCEGKQRFSASSARIRRLTIIFCTGASCGDENDCADSLTCSNGRCTSDGGSNPPPPPPCDWEGHCEGRNLLHSSPTSRYGS